MRSNAQMTTRFLSWFTPFIIILFLWMVLMYYQHLYEGIPVEVEFYEPISQKINLYNHLIATVILALCVYLAFHAQRVLPFDRRDVWYSAHEWRVSTGNTHFSGAVSPWLSFVLYLGLNGLCALFWFLAWMMFWDVWPLAIFIASILIFSLLWRSIYRWRAILVGVEFILILTLLYFFRHYAFVGFVRSLSHMFGITQE